MRDIIPTYEMCDFYFIGRWSHFFCTIVGYRVSGLSHVEGGVRWSVRCFSSTTWTLTTRHISKSS